MISVFVTLEEHKGSYTKVKNENDFGSDRSVFADKILINFGESQIEPETTIVIPRDVGFKLLDQLGVALTDEYTSLDHYITLQEKEVADEYKCPVCDEWSDRKDFNFE